MIFKNYWKYFRKKMFLIFLCLIFCEGNFSFYAFAQNSKENKEDLQIESEIVEQMYCSDGGFMSFDSNKWSGGLRIKLNITLTNTESIPSIIYKNFFAVSRIVIAKSSRKTHQNDYIVNNFLTVPPQFNRLDLQFPDEKLFSILEQNEKYTKTTTFFIPLTKEEIGANKDDYYMQNQIEIWGGGNLYYAKKLKRKWEKFGNLRLNPIVTERIPIKLGQNRKLFIENCF